MRCLHCFVAFITERPITGTDKVNVTCFFSLLSKLLFPLCSLCRVSVWIKGHSTCWEGRWVGMLRECTPPSILLTCLASPWPARLVNCFKCVSFVWFFLILASKPRAVFFYVRWTFLLFSPPPPRSGLSQRDKVCRSTEGDGEESTGWFYPSNPLHRPGVAGDAEPLLQKPPKTSSAGTDQDSIQNSDTFIAFRMCH